MVRLLDLHCNCGLSEERKPIHSSHPFHSSWKSFSQCEKQFDDSPGQLLIIAETLESLLLVAVQVLELLPIFLAGSP